MNKNELKQFYSLMIKLREFNESDVTVARNEVGQLLSYIERTVIYDANDLVFYEVANFFAYIRDYPLHLITTETRLKNELRMSIKGKEHMRVPFTKFVRKLGGSKIVTGPECRKCKTVGDCVELIKSKLS
ncbi:hypothetical protein POV27_03045 [Aureisphaera galaxeae]|uniref:hypothetical protein n=1 Tax=Aureisphaera galaxeae TaxID=1538023 RepID=UPI00234FF643|nr:hypothetical protein [Aureisphaera galaxeae]MDC8003010.1 hypothetical protein [Aureisphaera galaxeae]